MHSIAYYISEILHIVFNALLKRLYHTHTYSCELNTSTIPHGYYSENVKRTKIRMDGPISQKFRTDGRTDITTISNISNQYLFDCLKIKIRTDEHFNARPYPFVTSALFVVFNEEFPLNNIISYCTWSIHLINSMLFQIPETSTTLSVI